MYEQHSQSPPADPLARARRLGATLFLALSLLAVGGVAVVNASSPDPSASPSVTQSDDAGATDATEGDESTEGRGGHDCPDREGGDDSSGDDSTDDGATGDGESDDASGSST